MLIDSTDPQHWRNVARETLERALKREYITRQAKNVILFIGDGMGVSTVTAARIYKGQQHSKLGEESSLLFETFPNVAYAKVLSAYYFNL